MIEVRLNNLQMFLLDEALGKSCPDLGLVQNWYRLGLEHKEELARGRSVILTMPARLGALPADFYGEKPDLPAEWLPVLIRSLRKSITTGWRS